MILRRERGPCRQAASPPCERRRPAATATGGESFGRSLRRSNDSPEGCGSWTRRSSEPPPAEKPFRCIQRWRRGTRQRAIRRARRSARGFRGRTRRAVLSPVAQPPGEVYGRGRKGRTTARLMWSERRYRATRRAVFSPYTGQPPRCSLRGLPSQEGRIRGDQAARRAVFSHMRDSRRAELPGRSLPSDGR